MKRVRFALQSGRREHRPAVSTRILAVLLLVAAPLAGPLRAAQAGLHCFCGAGTLPPPGARYVATAGAALDFGNGVLVRDLQFHGIQDAVVPPLPGAPVWQQTTATLAMEVSFDAGASWHPEKRQGITRYEWDFDYVAGDTTGYRASMRVESSDPAGGLRLRTLAGAPHPGSLSRRAIEGGFMVESFFDIFLEVSVDGGASYAAADRACRIELRTDHRPAVPVIVPAPLWPMPCDEFSMPAETKVAFSNGIEVRGLKQKLFSLAAVPPGPWQPPLGHHFESQLELQVSTNGGPFVPLRLPAATDLTIARLTVGAGDLHEVEITGLDAAGGLLPGGLLLRESPTLRSGGLASSEPDPGGYRVSSFFDIFLEVSTDGGTSWFPGKGPARMQSRSIGAQAEYPSGLLPPPAGRYLGRAGETTVFANGLTIRNLDQAHFDQSILPPPPNGGATGFSWRADARVELSTDGGITFMPVPGSALVGGTISPGQDHGDARHFGGELVSADFLFTGGMPCQLRMSPTTSAPGRTSVRPAPQGGFLIDSFFDIFLEVSTDGGATWSPATTGPVTIALQPSILPPLAIHCPPDLVVPADQPGGRLVEFEVTAEGGCPPLTIAATPPGGSVFPPGATTVECQATDACGQTTGGSFTVTVTPRPPQPWFFPTKVLPPPTGLQLGGADREWFFPDGVVIRDLRERQFTASVVPPPSGGTLSHSYESRVDLQLSLDGGGSWQSCTATGTTTLGLRHAADNAGEEIHELEVQSWSVAGGTLPAGILIRESPSLASGGSANIRPTEGGFMVSSFFDIYIEVSTDGGVTWKTPLFPDAIWVYPDPVLAPGCPVLSWRLPAPDDQLASVGEPAAAAGGFTLRSVAVRDSDASTLPPPVRSSNATTFSGGANLNWDFGGGPPVSGRAPVTVSLRLLRLGSGSDTLCEAEVTGFDLAGGDLPGGVIVRESPGRVSRGMVAFEGSGPDGSVASFFDIFVEISTDGGATWQPSTVAPLHLESRPIAKPCQFADASITPPGGHYRCAAGTTLPAAGGVVLRNLRERNFSAVLPLPGAAEPATHTCTAWLDLDLSTDGGGSWQAVTGAVLTTLRLSGLPGTGGAAYFDIETLQFDVTGGTLPPGFLLRESPARPSVARAAARQTPGGPWLIDSFFDIYLEVSTDGGISWNPAENGPAHLELQRVAADYLSPTNLLPTPESLHVAAPGARAAFSNSLIARDAVQHSFRSAVPAPPSGTTVSHTFESQLDLQVSLDGGSTWQPCTAPATTTLRITGLPGGDGVTEQQDLEIVQLDAAGGGLPAGLMFRESPVRLSSGRSTATLLAGGWQIDRFFDIFIEVSTDGGASWAPTVNGPLSFSARLPDALESWRIGRFGTALNAGPAADGADPDRDRLANLVEFATFRDPLRPDASPGRAGASGGLLTFTYPRARQAAGLVETIVEWSATLEPGSWQSTGVGEAQVPGGDQNVQLIQATIPAVPGGRCFARLRVER